MPKSVIVGTGSYLPNKVVTNKDLEEIVDTSDEWITSRTGIRQRHIAADNENTSDMATEAAKRAIKNSGIKESDIDLIIVATTTPDHVFPSVAVSVQSNLKITNAAAFDIQAVCSGFVYGLSVANNFILSGQYKNVLVIGAEKMSAILDWQDRSTCVLFGDGAGCVVLQAQDNVDRGILSTHIHSDGNYKDILKVEGGVTHQDSPSTIVMQGQEVFKHAVDKMSKSVVEALKFNNIDISNVDWIFPHQANLRIIDMISKKLKFNKDKVFISLDKHANTSAASIPLALDAAVQENKIQQGQVLALTALGGGVTWGSCILKW